MNTVLVFLLVGVPAVLCVGGMAELKSITGDEQYNGPANAPAVLPQPQGFWGRPRYYSPMGSWNTMTPLGGNGWVGGDGSRFSSFSSGPYGTNHRFSPIHTTDSQFGSSSGAGGFGSPFSSGMGSGMGSAIDSSESMNRENLMLGALTVLGSLFNTDPSSVNGDLSQSSMPSSSSQGLPASFTIPRGAPGPSGAMSGSPSGSGAPLSSATGGGFFTGRGNDFVNKA